MSARSMMAMRVMGYLLQVRNSSEADFSGLPGSVHVEDFDRMHFEFVFIEIDDLTAKRDRFHLHPCVQLRIDRPQHRPWQRGCNHGIAMSTDKNNGILSQCLRQRSAELGIVDHQLSAQAWIVL